MKKIFTVIALALISSGAFAQFKQGGILLNGGLGFRSTTNKLESGGTTTTLGKQTDFTFNPRVGYFFMDHLAAGLTFDVTTSMSKADGSSNKSGYSITTVGPFVRYYLDQGLFFQGEIGFGGRTDKSVTGNTTTTTKYSAMKWDIGVGYAYFLGDNVAIEPLVYYGMLNFKDKDTNGKYKESGLGIQLGLTAFIGGR
jgi:outer membrane protein